MEQLVGAKAFLSLDRAGTFICRKDGKEVKYLVYQGAEFCEYDLLYEKETKEENGVIFEIQIESNERWEFEEKAKNKLAYYDTIALIIEGKLENHKIYREKDFQWTEGNRGEMHICLRDVVYDIDWNKLGIPRIYTNIALRFGLEDGLVVTPSRESLQYLEEVKEIIKKKICDVADWFVERYNETVREFDNFAEAIPYLKNSNKIVVLEGKGIDIEPLLKYSSTIPEELKVKGINDRLPLKWWNNLNRHVANFHCVGTIKWGGSYNSKNIYSNIKECISWGYKSVLLSEHPSPRMKEFIKTKYGANVHFFVRHDCNLKEYISNLVLKSEPKNKWRAIIKEYQEIEKSLIGNVIEDKRGLKESQEFLDYVEQQKALAKAGKGKQIGNYKTLDKQEGEVTLAYSREPLLGTVPVFEKETFKINELYKNSYITVVFGEDEKEEAKKYHNLHKSLKPAIVGKREKTKLPEIHSIMTEGELKKTALFKRIVTAIRIEGVLEDWKTLIRGKNSIIDQSLITIQRKIDVLKEYFSNNSQTIRMSDSVKEAFLLTAKENGLWDLAVISDVEEVEKVLGTFYFLKYIKEPNYPTEQDKRDFNRIVNQMLLFQKKYGALENYDLVEKPLPDEMMQEQLGMEEEFKASKQMEEEYV